MSVRTLTRILQTFVVVLILAGGAVFGAMVSDAILFEAQQFPEFAHTAKLFIMMTTAGYLIIAAMLFLAVLMLNGAAKGFPFSETNARFAGAIGYLSLAAIGYYSVEFALLLLLAAANPGVILLYLIGFFAGVTIAAAAFLAKKIIKGSLPATV